MDHDNAASASPGKAPGFAWRRTRRRSRLSVVALMLLVLTLPSAAVAGAAGTAAAPPSIDDRSDAGPHVLSARVVAVTFVAVSVLLTVLLLLVPSRAVAATRREVAELMRKQAAALQHEDRRRIASELHDGAGQALTAAHLQLEAMRAGGRADVAQIDLVLRLVEDAMDEIRRSTAALAPPALAELGLGPALVRHCAVFSSATGIDVQHEVGAELPELPAPVEIACYRVAQEALQNVARHAGAAHAWLRVWANGGQLVLEVEDDGVGPPAADDELQLRTIRERAKLMNAELMLQRGARSGLRVRLEVPLPAPGAPA